MFEKTKLKKDYEKSIKELQDVKKKLDYIASERRDDLELNQIPDQVNEIIKVLLDKKKEI